MYRQYATATWPNGLNIVGMPLWGNPDGIGIGQYEAAQNAAMYWDYFSWSQNVIDSTALLWSYQSRAYNYWQTQLINAAYAPPPWTWAGQYCPMFGYPAGPGYADYGDTEWMTAYNAGPNGSMFIQWFQQYGQMMPRWHIVNAGYVDAVCQTAPL